MREIAKILVREAVMIAKEEAKRSSIGSATDMTVDDMERHSGEAGAAEMSREGKQMHRRSAIEKKKSHFTQI